MVLEDSVVDEIEASVAAEGYVTLNQLDMHRWNGLIISNVTIHKLGSGAFNLTHKVSMHASHILGHRNTMAHCISNLHSGVFLQAKELENTHKVLVQDSQMDHIGTGGISVQGDVAVTIKDNTFGKLEDDALRVGLCCILIFAWPSLGL